LGCHIDARLAHTEVVVEHIRNIIRTLTSTNTGPGYWFIGTAIISVVAIMAGLYVALHFSLRYVAIGQ
jgi:hypothetical protein